MLRAALRPAPLALLALALAVATVCALLGQWQASRSQAAAGRPELERPTSLVEVIDPASTFTGAVDGQLVEVTGTFTGGPELRVPGRLQDGAPGSWLLAPLVVQQGDGSTALLPVVRGWAPDDEVATAPAPPTGEVAVVGRLLAGEAPKGVSSGASEVEAVSPADLVNLWDGDLYTGFVIAADPVPPAPLQVVPTRAPQVETDWRNVSYAFQWWLFAGFAVVVWYRIVRDRYYEPDEEEGVPPDWEDDDPQASAEDRPEHQEAR